MRNPEIEIKGNFQFHKQLQSFDSLLSMVSHSLVDRAPSGSSGHGSDSQQGLRLFLYSTRYIQCSYYHMCIFHMNFATIQHVHVLGGDRVGNLCLPPPPYFPVHPPFLLHLHNLHKQPNCTKFLLGQKGNLKSTSVTLQEPSFIVDYCKH